MTSATNTLDENRRPENPQQNSYSPVLDSANNQALIKEVTEALTAVLLQIQIFFDVTLCCWISVSPML
jgi:hypothetical protein